MYSRLARTSLGALAALLCFCAAAGTAYADAKATAKCSGAIIKAGSAFVQAEAKILQKCSDQLLKKGTTCDPVKKQASIDKARTKLSTTIVKACRGKDKTCDTVDADGSQPTLTEIGWNIGTCPNFEGGTCTNAITDCDDIPTCIQCIGEASVNQAIDLYFPNGRPASTGDKVLNKCQSTIGKAAVTFLAAKSKALSKCWGTKVKKTANCPADAQAAISSARAKFIKAIGKPCLGLNNSTIGLPGNCLAVTPEGAAACNGSVSSLIDVGNCVACVTEFKVDCPDRVAAVSVGATYPAECLVVPPTPTPTPTATATPSASGTVTPTVTPTPGVCGDNQVQAGEFCDGTATAGATCGPTFTCTNCNCACPSKVHFAGDATDPTSILDTAWTGISHRAPIISNGDVTVTVSCAATSRPCGTCNITGLAPNLNADAGQLNNRRCSHDPSIKCTVNGDCGGGNTCEYYFGSFLPLAAGGVTSCVLNRFNGPVTGTANIESGEAATAALLASAVYLGTTVDNPCARCVGDTTINDGVAGGTCSGGSRNGLACDGNGAIPGRADFGVTSLDCPMAVSPLAILPIDLTNATDPVTKTLTAASPKCTLTGFTAQNCLCDTCNNLTQNPCDSNADCVAVGATICGGKRCLGGTNAGAACTTGSQCPSGACNRPGSGTAPSGCSDDTTNSIIDCLEDGGSGEGTCTIGPVDNNCSAASGHPQRGCIADADCGGGVASCTTNYRRCFLTGGLTESTGTNALTAVGMEDPPMADVSNPTLGAVFCIGPTGLSAIDNVAGLPGPGRVTIKGAAEGLP